MHEYSIVSALIERVEEEAQARDDAQVRSVHVRIGELAGIEVELLKTAFDTFRERTTCRDAELVVHMAAARWVCPKCKRELAAGARLRCEVCAAPARLEQGDEIMLERIELEVRDV